jgi:eukaryotic-like serine/threonine-protein kinase
MLGAVLHSHYQIVKLLGIGKSGATFLAKDLDRIESPLYVVKQIEPADCDRSSPLAAKLFEIQATIADRVGAHPQVPSLVARFEDNGNRYLVRECIDGELLDKELLPQTVWSQTQVIDFLTDLLEILAFVHTANYIHQDINPQNIIRRQEDGRFVLIGFSTAKDATNNWQHPPHNLQLPDPSYIPYEQEQGGSHFSTDLYAVGAIAIQAVTGIFPLQRDPETYELTWKDDASHLDPQLITIIDRLVRPDYRNRYASAAEALAALEAFTLDRTPTTSSTWLQPRLFVAMVVSLFLLGCGVVKLFVVDTDRQLTGSPELARQTLNWPQYRDARAGLAIRHAPDWRKTPSANIVTGERVRFQSANPERISLRIENLIDPQMDLDRYTQAAIVEITKYYRDAKIVESKSTTLASKPASLAVYTGRDENAQPLKKLEVWTLDRGKAYILTYATTPDRYAGSLDTALATIQSFELK